MDQVCPILSVRQVRMTHSKPGIVQETFANVSAGTIGLRTSRLLVSINFEAVILFNYFDVYYILDGAAQDRKIKTFATSFQAAQSKEGD
jgi:hypothetical protein